MLAQKMSSNRRLVALAQSIAQSTATVDAYIEENDLPEPSYDETCPPITEYPPDVDEARRTALEALDELRDHLMGPLGAVNSLMQGFAHLVSLRAIADFNMDKNLRHGESVTVEELAEQESLHPNDVEMIVRHAATRHYIKQHPDGRVSHSSLSNAMVSVPNLHECTAWALGHMWTEVGRLPEAMRKWPGSQEINNTAQNYLYKNDKSFFELIAEDQRKAKAFADSMTYFTSNPALNPRFVLEYDWSQHANGTVVDVGGSQGQVTMEIAKKFPNIQLVVEDRPEVIKLAPKDAPSNVSFMEHDFFKPQPVKDADVYFFRWILHDWPDKFSMQILQALKPSLKAGTRIVVMDAILPEKGVLTPYQERPIRDFDIAMKLLFNARERYESEWKELINEALGEDNVKVVETIRPVGSQLQLLVIEWKG